MRRATKRTITLDTDAAFSDRVAYTIDPANASGNENHFQGLAALTSGEHYIVSGSNWKTGCGEVFSFHLPANASTGSSLHTCAVDFPLWHTGGIDSWGDIIVVPAECPLFDDEHPGRMAGRAAPPESQINRSTVFFLQGSTLQLLPAPLRIERPAQLATSAGLTRLIDGRFLTIVLSQQSTDVRVDAYLSVSSDLRDGFPQSPAWSERVPLNRLEHYQSFSLVTEESGDVFLVGLSGQKKGRIDVYLLGSGLAAPAQWVRFLSIPVDISPADFSAGGCITLIQGTLYLTATAKFRAVKNRKLSFTQHSPAPLAAVAQPLTPIG